MDFAKRYWAQIRAQLEGLQASQKWLIGALLVIMLLLGGLMMIFVGQPETVAISGFAGGRRDDVLNRLKASGVDANLNNGQIVVPVEQQADAIAMLVQEDLMTADPQAAFDEFIASQNPFLPQGAADRGFLVAKQTVLSQIIGKMRGVRSAHVVIDMPQNNGFGHTYVRPSASVTITMQGSTAMNKRLTEAISGMVSGAVAKMKPEDVAVIDALTGRLFTVRNEDDVAADDLEALVRDRERYVRDKIRNELLSYIPGVIVTVTVRNDAIQRKESAETEYVDTQPLMTTSTEEIERRDVQTGGEPGARSMAGMSIDGGGGMGTEETQSRTEETFALAPVKTVTQLRYAPSQTKQVFSSISVPRKYFVGIFKFRNPDADPPSDQDLQPIIAEQLSSIESMVKPVISAAELPGVLQVGWHPDDSMLMPVAAGSAPTGMVAMLDSNWVKPVSISLLALVSLGLMLAMVRKATQPESLPSVEELAGVPPSLPVEEELVGEAEEHETAMAGVEMDEDELRSRKVAEQISEMIKSNPEEAAGVLGKWVRKDD